MVIFLAAILLSRPHRRFIFAVYVFFPRMKKQDNFFLQYTLFINRRIFTNRGRKWVELVTLNQ